MVWEFVFLMLVLKIPVIYLGAVVWWAVRAEPRPLEGAALPVGDAPDAGPSLRTRRPRGRLSPRGGPARRPVRVARAALARGEARR